MQTMRQSNKLCRKLCADEFLNRMPKGLDTMLEQGGNNLSGGQKQRLCIARALLGKAKILIFDVNWCNKTACIECIQLMWNRI